ncbi:MAG: YeeE/YedE family protein, partial [Cereibacter changlensis]
LARLSPRSATAVGTFMAAAGVTVFLLRHVFGA